MAKFVVSATYAFLKLLPSQIEIIKLSTCVVKAFCRHLSARKEKSTYVACNAVKCNNDVTTEGILLRCCKQEH